jgi:hypothetical protein
MGQEALFESERRLFTGGFLRALVAVGLGVAGLSVFNGLVVSGVLSDAFSHFLLTVTNGLGCVVTNLLGIETSHMILVLWPSVFLLYVIFALAGSRRKVEPLRFWLPFLAVNVVLGALFHGLVLAA